MRRDFCDRDVADVGIEEIAEPAQFADRSGGLSLDSHLLNIFVGNEAERVARLCHSLDLRFAPLLTGIDAFGNLLPGLVALLPRGFQTDLWVFPKRELLLPAIYPVFETPKERSVRLDEDKQPVGIGHLIGLCLGLEILDLNDRQHGNSNSGLELVNRRKNGPQRGSRSEEHTSEL